MGAESKGREESERKKTKKAAAGWIELEVEVETCNSARVALTRVVYFYLPTVTRQSPGAWSDVSIPFPPKTPVAKPAERVRDKLYN